MSAMNSENINNCFDLIEEVFGEYMFHEHPEAIYNMDQAGMPLEPVLRRLSQRRDKNRH